MRKPGLCVFLFTLEILWQLPLGAWDPWHFFSARMWTNRKPSDGASRGLGRKPSSVIREIQSFLSWFYRNQNLLQSYQKTTAENLRSVTYGRRELQALGLGIYVGRNVSQVWVLSLCDEKHQSVCTNQHDESLLRRWIRSRYSWYLWLSQSVCSVIKHHRLDNLQTTEVYCSQLWDQLYCQCGQGGPFQMLSHGGRGLGAVGPFYKDTDLFREGSTLIA